MYAKVTDGVFEYETDCPYNLRLDDGRVIFGFISLSDEEKATHGYYKLVDLTPIYDPELNTVSPPTHQVIGIKVEKSVTVTPLPLEAVKAKQISKVYQKAADLLNVKAEGYSQPEIAAWPLIQADILAYNTGNSVVGPHMQSVIDQGCHTAASLSELLTPRIAYQQAVLSNRAYLVNTISSANDSYSASSVDITSGWPL